jgi:hypothetical protein
MKFKLLKPRRHGRAKRQPFPPEAFALLTQAADAARRKRRRQTSRRQTVLRLACAREITGRKLP